jgi:hypothetical protein
MRRFGRHQARAASVILRSGTNTPVPCGCGGAEADSSPGTAQAVIWTARDHGRIVRTRISDGLWLADIVCIQLAENEVALGTRWRGHMPGAQKWKVGPSI